MHNELGVLYWLRGQHELAEKNFDHAIHATVPYNSNEKRSILNNYACMCILRKNQPEQAEKYLLESLRINISQEGVGHMASNLASIYLFKKQLNDAFSLLQSAESLLPKSGLHNLKLLREMAAHPEREVMLSEFDAKCELQVFR